MGRLLGAGPMGEGKWEVNPEDPEKGEGTVPPPRLLGEGVAPEGTRLTARR